MEATVATKQQTRRANGEGSVRQRADGRWQFSMRQGKDDQGKIIRLNYYAAARVALMRLIKDGTAKGGGSFQLAVSTTIGELAEAFLAEPEPGETVKPADDGSQRDCSVDIRRMVTRVASDQTADREAAPR